MHIEHVLAAITLIAATACADPAGPDAPAGGPVDPPPEPAIVLASVEAPGAVPDTTLPAAPEPTAAPIAPAPVDALLEAATAPELDAATLTALARAANGDISALLHPELGVFLIHNMSGSMPHLVLRDRWPRREHGWLLEPRFYSESILEELASASTWAARPLDPDDPCDEGPSQLRSGSSGMLSDVLDTHMGWRDRADETEEQLPPWLERTHAELARTGNRPPFTPARWARLQRLAAAGSHHAYLEQGAKIVEFGRIDGRWYLLGIDATDDACG